MYIYYIRVIVACYMFRPSTVAIFRDVFFEGMLQKIWYNIFNCSWIETRWQ